MSFIENEAVVEALSPDRADQALDGDFARGYLRYDNDSILSDTVAEAIEWLPMRPTRSAYQSPWQNATAERWAGSARRELLYHVLVLNTRHPRRLLQGYVFCYNVERVYTELRDGRGASEAFE